MNKWIREPMVMHTCPDYPSIQVREVSFDGTAVTPNPGFFPMYRGAQICNAVASLKEAKQTAWAYATRANKNEAHYLRKAKP